MAKSVDDRGRGERTASCDEGAYCLDVTEEQRSQSETKQLLDDFRIRRPLLWKDRGLNSNLDFKIDLPRAGERLKSAALAAGASRLAGCS
jgi:hypothetical protein